MTRYSVNPDVLICPTEDRYLALDVVGEKLHELNPVASLIVELCIQPRHPGELLAATHALHDEFSKVSGIKDTDSSDGAGESTVLSSGTATSSTGDAPPDSAATVRWAALDVNPGRAGYSAALRLYSISIDFISGAPGGVM